MNNPDKRTTPRTGLIRAIVASGSLLAIIVVGLPWVDEYLHLRSDADQLSDLEIQLSEIQNTQEHLGRIENKLNVKLIDLTQRSVDPAKTESVRASIIEIVRAAGGRLRRLEIGGAETRPWAIENDNPLNGTIPTYGEESEFALHSHVVELRADGSLESVRQILSEVTSQGWLMTTKFLTMTPTALRESPMSLELRLVLFGLGPKEREIEDDFAFADRTKLR